MRMCTNLCMQRVGVTLAELGRECPKKKHGQLWVDYPMDSTKMRDGESIRTQASLMTRKTHKFWVFSF